MSSARVIPHAKPKVIKCTACTRANAGAKAATAAVACIACGAYLCDKCDAKAHADAKSHVRYPVSQLKSYIDFNAPVKAGESAPRSHLGSPGVAANMLFDGCATPYHTFWRSVKVFANAPCLGARTFVPATGAPGPYKWESYKEVGARVLNLANALKSAGLETKCRVGLYSQNRPEWIIGEQACYANNFITVPLYDTLGPEAAEQIIQQATVSAVICSQEKVPSLIEIASRQPHLTLLIVMPPQPFEAKPAPIKPSKVPQPPTLRIVNMRDAEKSGAATVASFKPTMPAAGDVATFCYTSGTTGMPKGAMLSHSNIINDMAAVAAHGDQVVVQDNESHCSFLPLAHMFERLTMTNILAHGGMTGFSRGNPLLLLEDVELVRPTTFAGVPRLYNRQSTPATSGLFALYLRRNCDFVCQSSRVVSSERTLCA